MAGMIVYKMSGPTQQRFSTNIELKVCLHWATCTHELVQTPNMFKKRIMFQPQTISMPWNTQDTM